MRTIIVADYFVDELPGGSERSLEAILQAAPMPLLRVKSHDFFPQHYNDDDFLIFGNFYNLPMTYFSEIKARFKYAVIESDYKACEYRNPDSHKKTTGQICDCEKRPHGNRIAGFYSHAEALFWKSEMQMEWHLQKWPGLREKRNIVISATYNMSELDFLHGLAKKPAWRRGWAVYKSNNWIKGYENAVDHCKMHGLRRCDFGNMEWQRTMRWLRRREGLVFLPNGRESCSRITVEARILGCKIIVNDKVPVAQEEWFKKEPADMIAFLRGRPALFWDTIAAITPQMVVAQ